VAKDADQLRPGVRDRWIHGQRQELRRAGVRHDEGDKLIYVARTRNGFTPSSRLELAKRFRGLETNVCPFANLPEPRGGRWGAGLTAAKMKDCRWLKPELVGQFEFVEWTPDDHLRHSRFMSLRDDKRLKDISHES
jgi:ATP-dependent DNA ligase